MKNPGMGGSYFTTVKVPDSLTADVVLNGGAESMCSKVRDETKLATIPNPSQCIFIEILFIICVCVCVMCVSQYMCVEAKGQFLRIDFLLLFCGFWGLNSDCQACTAGTLTC